MFRWLKRRFKLRELTADTVTSSRTGLSIGAYGTDRPEPHERLPSLYELVNVISVAQKASTRAGDVTIASVEVFTDGGVVRYFILGTGEATAAEAEFHSHFEAASGDHGAIQRLLESRRDQPFGFGMRVHADLKDDVGTRYRCLPGGGGGNTQRWSGEWTFYPAIPANARQLRIDVVRTSRPVLLPTDSDGDREPLHTFTIHL